jgi:hypothetical protein
MNDRIFSSIVVAPHKIFDRIRIISWKWLLAKRLARHVCEGVETHKKEEWLNCVLGFKNFFLN